MRDIEVVNGIIENIKRGRANLKLLDDKIIQNSGLDTEGKGDYLKVCEFGDDDTFKAVYRKDDKYYYVERQYCADGNQMGSCDMQYDKLYEVIL
ncbi:hypothetical protein [Clostridium rectalis]|uniref:hypothetical protein n=1 Tax=Clostridium rectalis TaxID=2040295 RepID=UPI000F641547|nr:hypothetical protein [Clostridium rectalis]